MAVRKNADGSITVGILSEKKPEEKPVASPPERKAPSPTRKRTEK